MILSLNENIEQFNYELKAHKSIENHIYIGWDFLDVFTQFLQNLKIQDMKLKEIRFIHKSGKKKF